MYLKLEDATSLMFPNGQGRVETATDYVTWQATHVAIRGIARVWPSDLTIKARVNHGRWIADCLYCRLGMFTHPDWRLACCAECGAVYRGVEFPAEQETITRLLLARPGREHQNWEPGEGIWKLRLENRLHGVSC